MPGSQRRVFSEDQLLDRILQTVVNEVKRYADVQRYHLNKYAEIGMSLTGEDDIDKLLEMIIFEAREITNADAGTLYMVNDEATHLNFVILQNDTMDTRMGGTSGNAITLPPVALYLEDGTRNHSNVSSHVAISGDIVNIADVYESDEFDFTGPRKYDAAFGYRSKSMMVIPMRNHENDIIGVLQLLNAQDQITGETIEFSDDDVGLIASLASQAAAAITKNRLIHDLTTLFDAFIKAIATAIEEKSQYTGGHIHRVAQLTMDIAHDINMVDYGPFKDVCFDADQMEELRIAAWLHDIGKITTPEFVVDKSSKLETIYDRVHLIELRFDLIAQSMEAAHLARKCELLAAGEAKEAEMIAEEHRAAMEELREEREFVLGCNHPGEFMADEKIERLKGIGAKTYAINGEARPYLTEDEIKNLSIRKGTLTNEERKIIENHALMTHKILSELPFGKKMTHVPEYAAAHHEKLDGSGYPNGLTGERISLQSRIMAVADVFEALTARDRPYKQPMPLSQAIKILGFMRKDKHIDPDIHDRFLESDVLRDYAARHLNPEQMDVPLVSETLPPRVLVLHKPGPAMDELVNTLAGWDLNVVAASSRPMGMIKVEESLDEHKDFGLIIVDATIDHPRGGFQLASRLADDDRLRAKVLLINPAHKLGDAAHACEMGVDSYLVSPHSVEELKEQVFGALNRPAPAGDLAINSILEGFRGQGLPFEDLDDADVRPRILVVDDSVNTRMLVEYFLKKSPYRVTTANNGRQGLELFASGRFALALMDLEMPVMNGYDAARAMRHWEREAGDVPRPIIALSGHSFKGDAGRREEAGYTDALHKPIQRGELLDALNRHLGGDSLNTLA